MVSSVNSTTQLSNMNMDMDSISLDCPRVLICHNRQWRTLNYAHLQMPLAMFQEQTDTADLYFCFGQHDHEEDSTGCLTTMTAKDCRQFILLCSDEELDPQDLYHFQHLSQLLEYFCGDNFLVSKLKSLAQDSVRLSPYSALTAYMWTPDVRQEYGHHLASYVMDMKQMPLLSRVCFAVDHDCGHLILSQEDIQSRSLTEIGQRWNVPIDLLSLLGPTTAVVAGGAAVGLGCGAARWDWSCDVDIFIFAGSNHQLVIDSILQCLRTHGWTVFRPSSSSVLTAIGAYGTRRVQLILTESKNWVDLIRDFDLNLTRAVFDGQDLHVMATAAKDWLTMTCSNGSYQPLKPKRLARAAVKGFKLSSQGQALVQATLGWPLPDTVKQQLLCSIPHLDPKVPQSVQLEHLRLMNLFPINNDDFKTTITTLTPLRQHQWEGYGSDEQSTFLNISSSDVQSVLTLKPAFGGLPNGMEVAYCEQFVSLRFPVARLCGHAERPNRFTLELKQGHPDLKGFTSLYDKLIRQWTTTEERIQGTFLSRQKTPTIYVRVNRHTRYWLNGLAIRSEDVRQNERVRCIGRPRHLVRHRKKRSSGTYSFPPRLKFLLTDVFVQRSAAEVLSSTLLSRCHDQ